MKRLLISRVAGVCLLLTLYLLLGIYFRVVLHPGVVYTHFAYLPVVLAAMWWGRKGIAVALLPAGVNLLFSFWQPRHGEFWSEAAGAFFLLVVAAVVGELSEKANAERKKAQEPIFRGQGAAPAGSAHATARKEAEKKGDAPAEPANRQNEQLAQSRRLAELGEMAAAAIAHELNQPLTGIRNFAKNAMYMIENDAGGAEDVLENLRLISAQVDRAAKIIAQMRELTRKSERLLAPVNLNGVVRDSVNFLMPQMAISDIEVTLELDQNLPAINGDRIRLEQVLLNLLTNAKQAMEESPERRLFARTRFEAGNAFPAVVENEDTGKGITSVEAQRLFTPFFTTKKNGQGTGLGLSISRAIIKDHRGEIEAFGAPGRGARFVVRLPAYENGQHHAGDNAQ